MLRLILGRAGSGKTRLVCEELTALAYAEEQGPLLLLVPEQYSFESERTLLELLGPDRAGRVQVLSFTRLAETVFREIGGLAGNRMDDGTRALLISRALEETAGELHIYKNHTADPDTLLAMLAVLSECRQCAVSPEDLHRAAQQMEEGTLRRKAQDLSLILAAYDALAANTWLDPLDDLTTLARRLGESRLLDGAQVYVDAFKGFTAQELAVLAGIMRRADSVSVTLCTDTAEDTSGGLGRFSPVIRTGARLRDAARANHVPVAPMLRLEGNHRAQTPALRALEEGAFVPSPPVCEEAADEVCIAACTDLYAECAFVARTIRRLLREEGGRCRDFAIVTRSLDSYRGVLDVALEREGIPFFMDVREDILTEPLVTLVLSALHCAADAWDTEGLLRLMKTGMAAGFSAHSVSLLENYAYMWRVHGTGWKRPFTENPEGLEAPDEASAHKLAAIDRLRRRLVTPISRLQATLSHGGVDGEGFARAIYCYLCDVRADRMVRLQAQRLEKAGEHTLAERMTRLWDELIGLLDRFAAALKGTVLSPARFTELFHLMVGMTDLGSIPQSLDAVQVGAADRMRFSSPAVVFLLGANEGVFPAYPTPGGVLSDEDRRRLAACGIELAGDADREVAEERFIAYTALAAPSRRLYVCYQKGNAEGETLSPSALVDTVRRILPACRVRDIPEDRLGDSLEEIESEPDAFSCLAAVWQQPSPLSATLRRLFDEQPAYQPRLRAMERAADGAPAAFAEAAHARSFFGDDMRLSPSRVEKYHRCRFAYFCEYGLRVKARRPADLDASAFGTLAHVLMERLLPGYAEQGFANVRRDQVFADAARTVREYARENMGGLENKSSRFSYLLSQLVRTGGSLLWQVVRELRQSRFVPADYELSVGLPTEEGGGYVEPLVLTLPDGARVRVQGKVDRVDVYRDGDTAYVRVVDYKTGAKQFRLSEVVEGINLQMLVYILSIWQNGTPRYGPVTPAGVLYLPAKLPVVNISRDADEEQTERARLRVMRMNGLLLDDPEIIRAMENEAAGLFIPARLTAQGLPDQNASVATLEQFGLLKKRMEKLLADMAATLRSGDIAAQPAQSGDLDACAYCDYRAVCGHEADDPVRLIADRDAAAVLKELAAQEEGDRVDG